MTGVFVTHYVTNEIRLRVDILEWDPAGSGWWPDGGDGPGKGRSTIGPGSRKHYPTPPRPS